VALVAGEATASPAAPTSPPPATPTPPPPTTAPPSAAIAGPATVVAGQPASFSATGSTASGPITAYYWDFGDGAQAVGATVTHVYDLAGQYVVRLTISDAEGRLSESAQAILVQPGTIQPPAAVFRGPASATVGRPVTFDASGSVPGGSPITAYRWSFGDGTSGAGQSVTHTYGRAGTFDVVLTVTDAAGAADSASQRLPVYAAQPPRAAILAPSSGQVGDTLTFDASGSTSGNPIVAYFWEFGDGAATDAVVARHAYGAPNTYTVRLTVIDTSGARNTATSTLTISPAAQAPPEARISGPERVEAGGEASYSASGSTPGASPIRSQEWTLSGPGSFTTGTGPTFTARFDLPGDYVVTLLVTDEAGLSDSATLEVLASASLSSSVWYLDGAQPPVTLSAKDGEAGGTTGCNTYRLTYTALGDATEGQLTMSPVESTRRSCPGFDMAAEARYFDTLSRATSYRIEGNRLTLAGPAGSLAYIARSPRP
jgi:PKD repeat protein